MSQEQAMAFIQRVNQDEPLRSKIDGLSNNLNALLTLAAETGYAFTAVEWNVALQQAKSEALSEDELDKVAGGGQASGKTAGDAGATFDKLAGFVCNERNLGGLAGLLCNELGLGGIKS
jgi:predicted ribosomally synthesized peptide with nif11-like leader